MLFSSHKSVSAEGGGDNEDKMDRENKHPTIYFTRVEGKPARRVAQVVDLLDSPVRQEQILQVEPAESAAQTLLQEPTSTASKSRAQKKSSAKDPKKKADAPQQEPKAVRSAVRLPRLPSIQKLQNDFEKLPVATRQELLAKLSTMVSIQPTETIPSFSAKPSSEEQELSSLRMQLTDTSNRIIELNAKEKRLRISIKKLQRKVAAANRIGGGAPEPLSVVIDRLFPPSTSGISVSSTGSMPLGSEAPLWLLAQQQEKTFNSLALPRVLEEAIYESLQTAYQIVEDIDNADIAQGASFDDIEIEVVDNVGQQPSSEALVQRSVFSQLLIELDDTSEHCIVHEANENKTTAVDADEVRKIATESEFGRAMGRLLLREKNGLTTFADPELNADVHNLLERLMKKNSKIGIAEELICWAWLVSTDNLPEPGPPRSPTDPHTQHELASTPLQQSENPHAVMNGKRSIEYHDMEPADLQPSRKALRVQTAIDLLSPDPSMSSPGDVVDLCNDSLHFAYDVCAPEDSYDNELLLLEEHTSASQQLDPSLPSTNPSISAATSSAPHETGRDEAKAAERRDEPSWESLSAGELQLMAAQYGLNPADKRLMQLLKAMWSRMKEPSQPLAASQPLSQAVTTSSRGATIGLEALRACLMQSAALYERVLLFLPLEVDDVQRHLKECGHKISKTQLLPLLDQLYIFVDSSGGKKDRSQPS